MTERLCAISQMESRYDGLQAEKVQLESAINKIPMHGRVDRHNRQHKVYIYIPTACPTMNSFAQNNVHHAMNTVSSEYLFLSCDYVCDWSSKLNGAKCHYRCINAVGLVKARIESFRLYTL